ncbi:hypothetical protein D9M69_604800 [compost metagenome]
MDTVSCRVSLEAQRSLAAVDMEGGAILVPGLLDRGGLLISHIADCTAFSVRVVSFIRGRHPLDDGAHEPQGAFVAWQLLDGLDEAFSVRVLRYRRHLVGP